MEKLCTYCLKKFDAKPRQTTCSKYCENREKELKELENKYNNALANRIRRRNLIKNGARKCIDCGKEFFRMTSAVRCEECQKAEKKRRQEELVNEGFSRRLGDTDFCVRCGKEYIVKGGKQKYCPECGKEKWESGEYQGRHFERKLGDTDFCVRCGEAYIIKNGKQKYCKKCADEVAAEKRRDFMRYRYVKKKAK